MIEPAVITMLEALFTYVRCIRVVGHSGNLAAHSPGSLGAVQRPYDEQ